MTGEIEISAQFERVLDFVNRTSQMIFLTGKAGTGKTTLLKYVRENTYKQMAVCAPTGVAAINAGGTTIHSFFQFPFTPFLPTLKANGEIDASGGNLPALKYNSQRLSLFRNLELLVIDEISMVRADLLDQIDITLRHTRRKWQQPFGGVQLLMIGDMHQLPPVAQNEEWQLLSRHYQSPYFFDSHVIKAHPPVYIELEKIYRQSDATFIQLLNKVRNNVMDGDALQLLNSHYKPNIAQEDYKANITLTTHNRKADEINTSNLEALPGKYHKFRAEVDGTFPEKNYPAAEELVLKIGARVMFLKNNPEKNYYNGKTGVIASFDEDVIMVRCEEDKREIAVDRETWTNVSYKVDKATKHVEEDVLGTFSQYPLRPAWAITIHKSQGLTFDKVIIDAAEAFSAGQVYVALSRCRSLEGLTLSSRIVKESLLNDQKIIGFASNRQDEGQLTSTLDQARNGYIRSILYGLFDFTEQVELRKELAALLQLHGNKLNGAGKEWAVGLFALLDKLREVDMKFRQQLTSLAGAARDLERDEQLQQRLQKASAYFSGEIDKCLNHLRECSLRTESREAATDFNDALQSLFETLFAKEKFIASCASGFNFDNYLKTKLKIEYPPTRISVYATAANSKVSGEVKHPALYRKLMLLRDEICNEDHKPIYMVANSKTLAELSNYLPETEEQLLSINGFGKAKVEDFGDRFLQEIRAYKLEKDISSEFEFKPKKNKKKKEPADGAPKKDPDKTPTREKTLALFESGLSPEEIASQRRLAVGTVLSHLVPFVAEGKVQIESLVPSEKYHLIKDALQGFQAEAGLGAIKSRLPEDISYADIRFVMAHKEQAE